MMTSVDHLQTRLIHWLSLSASPLSIDIDTHTCELMKVNTDLMMAGCVVTCNIGVRTSDVSPALLLQLTQTGLRQFVGIPSIVQENQYIVSKCLSLSGNVTVDSQKILGLLESLSNQTAVWRDIIAASLNRKSPHICQKAPSHTPYASTLPLTLSQQLQTYQDLW